MNREQYLLAKLAEECMETGQRATKAITFTLEEIQEGQDLSNAQRIVYELNDILAVAEILVDLKLLPKIRDEKYIQEKKLKLEKWAEYSQKLGTLDKI